MPDEEVPRFFADRPAARQTQAWHAFLERYAGVLYQVIQVAERDEDRVADAFVFCCEGLARDRFRRLRSFDPHGAASFEGWLRAVTRNLYLDWRRSRFGRARAFEALSRLALIDQEVYRCVYEQGLTAAETLGRLRDTYPGLTDARIEESLELLGEQLSPEQQWRLQARATRVVHLDPSGERDGSQIEPRDASAADPEDAARAREEAERLHFALRRLEPRQRLLLRLRYREDLPLREVARLMEYRNPQQADRAIREALAVLRRALSEKAPRRGGRTVRRSV